MTAALLKRSGFDVQGVFLKFADLPNFKQGEKGARKIAKILRIPFFNLDLRKEFKKEVIDYFLKEYQNGRTPNPCVICNEKMKLGFLLKKAHSLGFDFLATGHYVKKSKVPSLPRLRRAGKNQKSKIVYKLFIAKDGKKDQSYFLWRLTQKQLKNLIFPLGNYTKTEVKELAKNLKISKLIKSESQDVCFIRDSINDFLRKNIKAKPGPVVEQVHCGVKKTIGRHQGLCFYTFGQRKGINIGGTAKPFYVVDKDIKRNALIVSQNLKDLEKKELICKKVNWISGKKPRMSLKAKVKIRYRHKSVPAVIKPYCSTLKVVFDKPQRAITAGQSAVFYRGKELLGGGTID